MEIDFFWTNVLTLMKKQGKTKKSLSLECGLSERRIDNLSIAKRIPDAIEAVKIAQALNTSVEYLVIGEESRHDVRELQELKAKYDALALAIKGMASTL